MAAANSSGGVMGKMIDAQSIVVASTATALVRPRGRRSSATSSSTAWPWPPSWASSFSSRLTSSPSLAWS
ncbi:MAG: L-lactate permease [Anaerotruncus sp.]|nr:L-lactate permease [Anaerotruncus sp.]